MNGGDLFRRFFARFLVALLVAFALFLVLFHLFQKRTVFGEWQEDLRQEAHWLALHTMPDDLSGLTRAWQSTHSTIRLTFYDDDGRLIADSHPERAPPQLHGLLQGQNPSGYLAAAEALPRGGWLVMSRPWVPAFPHGLQWEMIAAAVLIIGLVIGFLYPLVRALSATMGQLSEMAHGVSSGHFGKTLIVDRSDALGPLVQAFNDMSSRLAEAEALETRLLHDVSHELRSPLGRIKVMAQTIALYPDEREECVHGIEEEVALLDRLVGDLIHTARIESETQPVQRETFRLRGWAAQTLGRMGSKARSSDIAWISRLPKDDIEVRGDPQRLAQAVSNLIDNAVHALVSPEPGSPSPAIEASVSMADNAWSVTIADNGPGIPAADLPHVFRRFYRVDRHRDRDRGGVGLGLSLVRAIVEAHGGQASIASEPGQGTRVTFSIPVR